MMNWDSPVLEKFLSPWPEKKAPPPEPLAADAPPFPSVSCFIRSSAADNLGAGAAPPDLPGAVNKGGREASEPTTASK